MLDAFLPFTILIAIEIKLPTNFPNVIVKPFPDAWSWCVWWVSFPRVQSWSIFFKENYDTHTNVQSRAWGMHLPLHILLQSPRGGFCRAQTRPSAPKSETKRALNAPSVTPTRPTATPHRWTRWPAQCVGWYEVGGVYEVHGREPWKARQGSGLDQADLREGRSGGGNPGSVRTATSHI